MEYKIIEYKDFPEKLKIIKKAPQKLYVKGNVDLLYEESFAIVGTRKITDYGKNNCKFFTKELTLRDIPIVSGMAIGTDSIAHKTCLENDGKTIAVLGSGFNNIFPKENTELFYNILDNDGLLITEFEPDIKPQKENFPKRNRIITAISEGILVIEAGYRSGTSITVRNAKEQSKKVFALPGKLDSCVGIGVNKMIKKGAILTTSIEDILENFPNFKTRKRRKNLKKFSEKKYPKNFLNFQEGYLKIFEVLMDDDKNLEELIQTTKMNPNELMRIISNMELEGLVEQNYIGEIKIAKKYTNI